MTQTRRVSDGRDAGRPRRRNRDAEPRHESRRATLIPRPGFEMRVRPCRPRARAEGTTKRGLATDPGLAADSIFGPWIRPLRPGGPMWRQPAGAAVRGGRGRSRRTAGRPRAARRDLAYEGRSPRGERRPSRPAGRDAAQLATWMLMSGSRWTCSEEVVGRLGIVTVLDCAPCRSGHAKPRDTQLPHEYAAVQLRPSGAYTSPLLFAAAQRSPTALRARGLPRPGGMSTPAPRSATSPA